MTTAALTLSSVLFAVGVFGVLTRRNAIALLVSVEIMMNAANINLVAFSRVHHPEAMTGQVFALLGIGIAACEAAVGLALILAVRRRFGSTDVHSIDLLKG
ncbi:MAG TPA: NADH-quinone oxidoreductase subunit NuoK [Solirubrobacterales bacterium]|nr:NADH-quinone oxidoreductase subunit NuoK [Solirubrobacterales bacterium]